MASVVSLSLLCSVAVQCKPHGQPLEMHSCNELTSNSTILTSTEPYYSEETRLLCDVIGPLPQQIQPTQTGVHQVSMVG